MVAVVTGSGLGLFNSSASLLGSAGATGQPSTGRSTERVYVNTATGNLIIQNPDEALSSIGLDIGLLRTYNSQGKLDDDNGDNWKLGVYRRVYGLTGTINTAGSSVIKVFGDGAEITYTYDAAQGKYVSTEGDGAHDTLTWDAGASQWTWQDGSSRATETFDSTGKVINAKDADGNTVTYTYSGSLLTQVTDASGQDTFLDYTGNNLTQIRVVSGGQTQTLTRYAYDGQNRLSTVTVDLSPADNSVADNNKFVTTYTYDGASTRVASLTQRYGVSAAVMTSASFTYQLINGDYRVATYTDGEGRVTSLAYSGASSGGGSSVNAAADMGQLSTTELQNVSTNYPLNSGALTQPWSAATTIDTQSAATANPIVRFDSSGNGMALWTSGNDIFTRRYTASTDSWSSVSSTIDNQNNPASNLQLAVDANGDAIAAWTQKTGAANNFDLYVSRFNASGGTWSSPSLLESLSTNVATAAGSLSVSMSGGFGAVAWLQPQSGSTNDARVARWNGSAWTSAQVIEGSSPAPGSISVAIDSQGNVTTVFSQDSTANIYANRWLIGNSTAPTTSSAIDTQSAATSLPLIAFDSSGDGVAMWVSGTDIFTRRYTRASNTWSSVSATIDSRSNTISVPQLAMDASGNAVAAWVQSDGTANSVYVARFTKSSGTWATAAQIDVLSTAVANSASTLSVAINGTYAAVGWLQPPSAGANADARVALWNGSSWSAVPAAVDSQSSAAAQISLAVDNLGNVTTLIQQDSTANIYAARYTNINGQPYYVIPTPSTWRSVAATLYNIDSVEAGAALQAAMGGGALPAPGTKVSGWPSQLSVVTSAATDDFNRADGGLGSPWARNEEEPGTLEIVGNQIQATRYAYSESLYSPTTYAADQFSSVRYVSGLSPGVINLVVRARDYIGGSGTQDSYRGQINGYDGYWRIIRVDNDVETILASGPVTYASGDNFSFEASGSSLILRRNGATLGSVTDGTYTSGDVGVGMFNGWDLLVDNWQGGSLASVTQVPVYYIVPSGASWPSIAQAIYGTSDANAVAALQAATGSPTLATNLHLPVPLTLSYTPVGAPATQTVYLTTDVTDALGQVTTYTKDSNGRLLSVQSPTVGGVRLTTQYAYDAQGNVSSVTEDPTGLNRLTTFEYDSNGNLTLSRDGAGNTVTRTYSATQQLLTESTYLSPDTDGSGSGTALNPVTTRYVYDAEDHLRFSLSAEGRVTEYRYNASGQRIASLKYLSGLYSVGALGQTTSPTESQMNTWVGTQNLTQVEREDYTYDFRGNIASSTRYASTDSSGNGQSGGSSVTRYTYDQRGLLLSVMDPRGEATTGDPNDYVTNYTYDGYGRELSRSVWVAGGNTDTKGSHLTSYDDANNRVVTTFRNGLVSTSVFDRTGAITSLINSNLSSQALGTTTYTYDADGRLRVTTDPTGVKQYLIYDEASRVVGKLDGDGTLTEIVYNRAGQPVKQVVYADRWAGSAVGTLVDGSGNPLPIAVATLRSALPTTVGRASDQITRVVYDAAGRKVYDIAANGAVTQTFYDGANRVTDTVQYANVVTISASVGELRPVANELVPGNALLNRTLNDTSGGLVASLALDSTNDRRTRNLYSDDGLLLGLLDAAGYLVEWKYDNTGHLIQQIGYANQTNSTYWNSGTLADLRPATDTETTADPEQDVVSYFYYDHQGRRVGVLDAEGYLTETSYGAGDLAVSSTRYDVPLTYNSDFATLKAGVSASANRHSTLYSYDGAGRVTQQIERRGTASTYTDVVTTYAYDGADNLTSTTRAAGTSESRQIQTKYDELGRIKQELTSEGSAAIAGGMAVATAWAQYSVTHNYDLAGRRIDTTDQNGNKTLYFYDADNRLVYTVNALGEVSKSSYNALGQLTDVTRYLNRISTASLAGGTDTTVLSGRITTNAADAKTSYTYTLTGALASEISVAGSQITYARNAFGEITTQQHKLDAARWITHTYQYDVRGLVKVTTWDPGASGVNRTQTDDYDAFGRRWRSKDQYNTYTRTDYDRLGRVTATYSGLNNKHWQTYDAFDRVFNSYDALNNLTTYRYDDAARQMTVTTPEGVVVTTVFNRHGQTLSVTANGNVTSYGYDANGNLASTSDSLGTLESRLYDRAGRETDLVNARGVVTHFAYDASDRVLTRTEDYGGANLATTYAYDALGRVTDVTEPSGRVTHTDYDADSRITMVTVDPAGLNLRTQYAYDNAGNTVSVIEGYGSANPRRVQYVYDSLGRRTDEYDDATALGGTLNLRTQYKYDANGNLTRKIDAKGNSTWFIYDADNRVTHTLNQLDGSTVAVTQSFYDAEGRVVGTKRYASTAPIQWVDRVTSVSVSANPAADRYEQTVYDRDGRSVYSIDSGYGVTERLFDAAGNVLREHIYATPLAAGTYSTVASVTAALGGASGIIGAGDRVEWSAYDARNRKAFRIDGAGAVTGFQCDANGNVVQSTAFATLRNTGSATDIASLNGWAAANVSGSDRTTRYWYDNTDRVRFTLDSEGYLRETRYLDSARQQVDVVYAAKPSLAPGVSLATVASIAAALPSAQNQTTTTTFDTAGRTSSVTDALNRTESYLYDAVGNKIQFTNAKNAIWTYEYDANHRLLAENSPLVDVYGFTSPSDGNLGTPALSTQSIRTTYQYDANGNMTVRTEAANTNQSRVTNYAYDAMGRQRTVTQPTVGVYNAGADNIIAAGSSVVRQETATSLYTQVDYDALGNAWRNRDAAGAVSYKLYDSLGRVKYDIDAMGFVTAHDYDVFGNETKLTRYANAVSTAGFTDALGGANAIALNPSADDRVINKAYDRRNRVISVFQPSVYVWDPTPGQQTAQGTSYNASPTTLYEYDAFGNVVRERTQTSQTTYADTYYYYDHLNRQIGTVDALGFLTSFEYDESGDLTRKVEFATALPWWNVSSHANPEQAALGQAENVGDTIANGVTLVGTSATKTSGVDAWDSGFRSRIGYTGGATVTFTVPQNNKYVMVGLNSDPTTNNSYDSIDYAMYAANDGNLYVYQNGSYTAALGAYKAGDSLSVSYDGSTVRYMQNGKVLYSVAASISSPLYADSSFHSVGAKVDDIEFSGAFVTNGVMLQGSSVRKAAGNANWDAGASSRLSYSNGASVSFTTAQNNRYVMVGLNSDPTTDGSYASIDYAIYLRGDGSLAAYESGGYAQELGSYKTGDRFQVVYDGSNVRYLKNGVVLRSVSASIASPLYADTSFYDVGGEITNLQFGRGAGDRETTYIYDRLNQKTSETLLVGGGGGLYLDRATTTYTYDGVGNQTSATTNGATTYTYYDALGQIIAVAEPTRDVDGSGSVANVTPLTVYHRDGRGNLIEQIQYADGAASSPTLGTPPNGATASHPTENPDRITRTAFDALDHAIQVRDALGNYRYASYTARGDVAKEWQPTTNNDGATETLVTRYTYDALGRQTHVEEPQTLGGAPGIVMSHYRTEYNAFGEVERKYYVPYSGTEQLVETNRYDGAGRLWFSNSGDGIDKIYLYNLAGQATVVIRSAGQDLAAKTYGDVTGGLPGVTQLRTETIYDAKGNVVEQRDVSLTVPSTVDPMANNFAISQAIGGDPRWFLNWTPPIAGAVQTVQFRVAGSGTAWSSISGTTATALVNGKYGVDISSMSGTFEFRVVVQWQGAQQPSAIHYGSFSVSSTATTSLSVTANSAVGGGAPPSISIVSGNTVTFSWPASNPQGTLELRQGGGGWQSYLASYQSGNFVVTATGVSDGTWEYRLTESNNGITRSLTYGTLTKTPASSTTEVTFGYPWPAYFEPVSSVSGSGSSVQPPPTSVVMPGQGSVDYYNWVYGSWTQYSTTSFSIRPVSSWESTVIYKNAQGNANLGALPFGTYVFERTDTTYNNAAGSWEIQDGAYYSGTFSVTPSGIVYESGWPSGFTVNATYPPPTVTTALTWSYATLGPPFSDAVYIDGVYKGTTQSGYISLAGIADGSHTFQINRSDNYSTKSGTFNLSGSTVTVTSQSESTYYLTTTAGAISYPPSFQPWISWSQPLQLPGDYIVVRAGGYSVTPTTSNGVDYMASVIGVLPASGSYQYTVEYYHSGASQPYRRGDGTIGVNVTNTAAQAYAQSYYAPSQITGFQASGNLLGWTTAAASGASVLVRYRQQGASSWAGTWSAFGWSTGYAVDLTSFNGAYEYEVTYTRPGEGTAYAIANGTVVVSHGTLTSVSGLTDMTAGAPELGSVTVTPRMTQTTDRWGNVIQFTDAAGQATDYHYNERNQVTEVRSAQVDVVSTANGIVGATVKARPVSHNIYDAYGNLIATIDANGNRNRLAYNEAGQVVAEITADGSSINGTVSGTKTFRLNAFGERIQVTDELGYRTRNTFDAAGQQTLTAQEAVAGAFTNSADPYSTAGAAANLLTHVYAYDQSGRRKSETSGALMDDGVTPETTRYWYDLMGHLVKRTTPRGNATQYEYDQYGLGKKTRETDAIGGMQSWAYDGWGKLTGHTDIAGDTGGVDAAVNATYTYNEAGQITSQTDGWGRNTQYTYDGAGHVVQITEVAPPTAGLAGLNRVTDLTYDVVGRVIREKITIDGVVHQNTVTQYDALGRIANLSDPRYTVTYQYDAGGNRTHIAATYMGSGAQLTQQDLWYAYDGANRVTISQGANIGGLVAINTTQGLEETYNARGERTSVKQYGYPMTHFVGTGYTDPIQGGGAYPVDFWSRHPSFSQEHYNYDGAGRLTQVQSLIEEYDWGTSLDVPFNTFWMVTDSRTYDGASRQLTQTRVTPDLNNSGYVYGYITRQSTSTYDDDGRLAIQTTLRNGANESSISYGDSTYSGSDWSSGFDAAGNLRAYIVTYYASSGAVGYTSTFRSYYRSADSYQETAQSVTSYNGAVVAPLSGYTYRTYNVNGELVQYTDSQSASQNRWFANNAQGQAINILTGSADFGTALASIGTAGMANLQSMLVANGEQIGSLQSKGLYGTFKADFDVNYEPISEDFPANVPAEVVTQEGDTLRTVAQRIFGDSSLWYLIAEENGLSDPNAPLTTGVVLRIPNDVVSIGNTSSNFKPYSVADALGDTTPTQPSPPVPKAKHKKGCGFFGQVLMFAVAFVVTVYSAGLATGATSGVWGAGLSALGGGAVGGLGAVGASIVGGAAGSIASQAVGIATGNVDKFSWKGVAMGAVGAGVGAGLGQLATGVDAIAKFAEVRPYLFASASGAAGSALTQGISVAAGLQSAFSWKDVAISAVAAPVAKAVGGAVSRSFIDPQSAIATFAGRFAGGISGSLVRGGFGGKIDMTTVVADAFGNALGNSIVDKLSAPPTGIRLGSGNVGASGAVEAADELSEVVVSSERLSNNPIASPIPLTMDEIRLDSTKLAEADLLFDPEPEIDEVSATAKKLESSVDIEAEAAYADSANSEGKKVSTGKKAIIDIVATDLEKSSTLKSMLNRFNGMGGNIAISEDPNFSTSTSTNNVITFNPEIVNLSPDEVVRELSHELAHALYKNPFERTRSLESVVGTSSHEEFIERFTKAHLMDEGEAKLMEISVQEELGRDIGALRGDKSDVENITRAFSQMRNGEITRDQARILIGNVYEHLVPNHMSVTYATKLHTEGERNWKLYVERIATPGVAALIPEVAMLRGQISRREVALLKTPNDKYLLEETLQKREQLSKAEAKLKTYQKQLNAKQ